MRPCLSSRHGAMKRGLEWIARRSNSGVSDGAVFLIGKGGMGRGRLLPFQRHGAWSGRRGWSLHEEVLASLAGGLALQPHSGGSCLGHDGASGEGKERRRVYLKGKTPDRDPLSATPQLLGGHIYRCLSPRGRITYMLSSSEAASIDKLYFQLKKTLTLS